ncbi:hypothetical protein VTN77DRAFT_8318 [Rasamsonia byssochlamydoides]|uniref:uncharacterized protein n=1 Tax=Rasamsonia byssochlamydoides TaxID=89139 RepID=UPI003742409A
MALKVIDLTLELHIYLSRGLRYQRSTGKNYWRSRNVPAPCRTNPRRVKATANIKPTRPTIHKKGRSQIRSGRREKRQCKGLREPFPVLVNATRIAQDATKDGDIVMEDASLADAADIVGIHQSSCQALIFSHESYPWENRQWADFLGAPMVIATAHVQSFPSDQPVEDHHGCVEPVVIDHEPMVIDQVTPAVHAKSDAFPAYAFPAYPAEKPLYAPETAFVAFTAQTVIPLYFSPRDDRLEELVRLMAALQISSPSDNVTEPQFIHLRRRLPWYKTSLTQWQVRDIENALARISAKRDEYKRRQRKKRHSEVVAIQYLEAVNDPTVDEDEILDQAEGVCHTFHLRPAGMPRVEQWPAAVDRTSNITPTRIPVDAKCPHRPRVPQHLVAAKVPLHNKYKPETPLLKTVMWKNLRNSLADGLRELRDRRAAADEG